MRDFIDLIRPLFESALNLGNVEGVMQAGPVHYDQVHGLGSVPDNQSVAYKGFACYMYPEQFLNLAASRNFEKTSSIKYVEEVLSQQKPIGSPFLDLRFDPRDPSKLAKVMGHEGRTRCKAIQNIFGRVPVLVHCFLSNGLRARSITIDHVAAFHQAALPEKSNTPTGPNCDPQVYFQGWQHLPPPKKPAEPQS